MIELIKTIFSTLQDQNCWLLSVYVFLFYSVLGIMALSIPFNVKSKNEKRDLQNRLVSIPNGFILSGLGAYYVFVIGPDVDAKSTPYTDMVDAIALGYFFYDMLFLGCMGILSLQTFIHHAASVVMFVGALYTRDGAAGTVFALYFAEVTNLFMHLRVFIKSAGLRHSKLYENAERLFVGTYVYLRCIAVWPYFIPMIMAPSTPWTLFILAPLIMVQSHGWALIMCKMLWKRYLEWKERKENGVKLYWFSENKEVYQLSYT